MKRTLALILSVALLLTVFSAVAAADDKKTLTVWIP